MISSDQDKRWYKLLFKTYLDFIKLSIKCLALTSKSALRPPHRTSELIYKASVQTRSARPRAYTSPITGSFLLQAWMGCEPITAEFTYGCLSAETLGTTKQANENHRNISTTRHVDILVSKVGESLGIPSKQNKSTWLSI